jgi:hypothetical protein
VRAEVGTAPGDPEDPLPPPAVRCKAFHNLAHGGVAPDAADRVLAAIEALDAAPDLSALTAALSAGLAAPDERLREGAAP